MYTPTHFAETDPERLRALIEAYPLGAVVTSVDGVLDADHIPFEFAAPTQEAPFGVLRAHVARANPLWKKAEAQVMVLFQGPQAYISPALYGEKAATGKVVPTWNYAMVHAHGVLHAIDDPAWLLPLLERLTAQHEAARAQPWAVADAPADYIATMQRAIVGIEIVLTKIEGKFKLSQNRPAGDQVAVAGDVPPLAPWMAPR